MTIQQQAIADGFAVTLSAHGQTWTRASDSASVVAVLGSLKKDDPRLVMMDGEDLVLFVADTLLQPTLAAAQCMPTTRIKQGDILGKGARNYRVKRADFEESAGIWSIIVSPYFINP